MSRSIEEAIPENTAVQINRLELLTTGKVPAAFGRDVQLIADKWQKRCLENLHLFNGLVFLQSNLQLDNGLLSGESVELDYASFMHWRGNPPFQAETSLHHVFPLAALESAEGHLIAVRSARTTVNSGLVYFAAGMFDGEDVRDGRLAPYQNMRREVSEETGLDLGQMETEGELVAFRTGRFIALFQRFKSQEGTAELVEKINKHTAGQAIPEIDDAIVITDISAISDKMPGYMQAYCKWRLMGL
jgi:8-oxo-dGTP pyrophosphatase MutT (NUDIX family)